MSLGLLRTICRSCSLELKFRRNISAFYRVVVDNDRQQGAFVPLFQHLYKYSKATKAPKEGGYGVDDYNTELDILDKATKVVSTRVESLRVDLLLKAGLGLSRNKVEKAFYDSKIRVNGEKFVKKSLLAHEGDEIDLVRGTSPMNPDFIIVSRIEVLNVTDNEDYYTVALRRTKSLTVENYDEPWKPAQ